MKKKFLLLMVLLLCIGCTRINNNNYDVIGNDVSKFCDEFINAYVNDSKTLGEKLNKEIMERFNKEDK